MYRAVKVSCRYSGLYTMNEGDRMQPYHLKKVGISTLKIMIKLKIDRVLIQDTDYNIHIA